MFETLISDPGSSLWAPVSHIEELPIATGSSSVLPIVQPGQLWFVELPPTELELSPLEYQALTTANVVIYDRALAPTVARLLPLGGYAEPAPAGDGAADEAWKRCRRFARDGWSVTRLVDPQSSPRGPLSKELSARETPAASPVLVFVNDGGGGYHEHEGQLDELDKITDARSSVPFCTLTVIFGAIGGGAGPRVSVASANGLAG